MSNNGSACIRLIRNAYELQQHRTSRRASGATHTRGPPDQTAEYATTTQRLLHHVTRPSRTEETNGIRALRFCRDNPDPFTNQTSHRRNGRKRSTIEVSYRTAPPQRRNPPPIPSRNHPNEAPGRTSAHGSRIKPHHNTHTKPQSPQCRLGRRDKQLTSEHLPSPTQCNKPALQTPQSRQSQSNSKLCHLTVHWNPTTKAPVDRSIMPPPRSCRMTQRTCAQRAHHPGLHRSLRES